MTRKASPDEMEFLETTCRENGHRLKQVLMCPQPGGYNAKTKRQAHLSCSSSICPDDLQPPHQMLAKHSIKSVGLLPRKISSLLLPVKDDLGLRTPRVYSLLCECGQVYIGQTDRSIETRMKEQH